jgi:hypothetical protein
MQKIIMSNFVQAIEYDAYMHAHREGVEAAVAASFSWRSGGGGRDGHEARGVG